MRTERYLEHVIERRPSIGAHVATLALASVASAFGKFVPTGEQNIPAEGPVILAANHISYADTILLNAYFYLYQRTPTIMAKDSLFKFPTGTYMRAIHALPVFRGQGPANKPVFDTAQRILDRGDTVVIYPEGTAGAGEDYWPIRGKQGLGALAIASGAPVIPVAHWGAQNILWRGDDGKQHASVWPLQKPIGIDIGEPMTFSRDENPDAPNESQQNQAVTDAVMSSIVQQLAVIRGEEPGGHYAQTESRGNGTIE